VPGRGTGRATALDGLRGVAACAVVLYHAILHNDPGLVERVLYQPLQASGSLRDALTKLALTCLNGEVAVYIFFVLSGSVLRLSLESRRDTPAWSLCAGFAGARLLRLYPPTIACMAIMYVLSQLGIPGYPIFGLREAVMNAALLQTLMHGPSTTIQVEVMAIPFILSIWLLRRRFGLAFLGVALIYSIVAMDAGCMVLYLPNMHAYLIAFVAGMLVAEPLLRPLIREAPAETWWATVAALVVCRLFQPHSSSFGLIAMILAAALLVGGLLYGQVGSLAVLLQRPVAQALGRISFSLYLLNVPVLLLLWALIARWTWPTTHALEAGLLVGAASLLLTWPLAWASERWIERPSVTASRLVWTVARLRERDRPVWARLVSSRR